MSAKKDIARAKRRWEQQVGPALTATATLARYRGTLTHRDPARHPQYRDYTMVAVAIDRWVSDGRATYLVDDDLTDELRATPLPDGETPHEVFRRRPHTTGLFVFATPPVHSVWIDDTPTAVAFDAILVSELADTDRLGNAGTSLRLTAIGHDPETGRTLSITFTIPLGEFWEKGDEDGDWVRLSGPTTVNLEALHAFDRDNALSGRYPTTRNTIEEWSTLADLFHLGVNLMLYVSATEPDLEEVPVPTVSGRRVLSPRSPAVHRLGFRVGAVLRAARAASSDSTGTGGGVTPHLRRAHWHRYWTGPRTGERRLVLRWVSQTFVNADQADFPPAVRPLSKSA